MAKQIPQLLYTRKDAAELLGVSTQLLKRLDRAGKLEAIKLTGLEGSQVHYRLSDLKALVGIEESPA